MKRDVVALWIAGRDARTPVAARVGAIVVAAYALSPIDLIPDFIPILGYIDDLILVPVGIALVVRLIPAPLLAELRRLATRRLERPTSRLAAAIIVMLWMSASMIALLWAVPLLRGETGPSLPRRGVEAS